MSVRFALIIANTEYNDPNLAQLTAPVKDAEDLAQILREKDFCAFDEVQVLLNEPESVVSEAIDVFFGEKKPDDLLLLYFSGHGVRDERGALYLAVKNTNHLRLLSTAIKSDFVREAMEHSRSKRQILILDCCNSGAVMHGAKAAIGVSIGTASAFDAGYGRIILTASDALQFAWEGNQIIGDNTQKSLFTHFLVEGLRGEADLDGNGSITVDELYEYAYEKVREITPKQTPSKFSTKQQGDLILRQNITNQYTKFAALPDDLRNALNSPRAKIREGVVHELKDLLDKKDSNLASSARIALEQIATTDETSYIRELAAQALKPGDQIVEKAEEEQKIWWTESDSHHQNFSTSNIGISPRKAISLRQYNRDIETMIDRGQLDEALTHCRHILKTFPKHLETRRLLGKVHLEKHSFPEAVDTFSSVLASVPNDFISNVGISIIREDENRLDDAIWHMERAFDTQPANVAIQKELQRLYGQRDGISPPRIRMTRGTLAHMYVQGELYPQAISEIKTVLKEDPSRYDMQVLLALAHYKSGSKNQAVEIASSILSSKPYCLDANRILVETLGKNPQQYVQTYLQRLVELDPYIVKVKDSIFLSNEVPDNAVTIEQNSEFAN